MGNDIQCEWNTMVGKQWGMTMVATMGNERQWEMTQWE